ncbi:MAG: hypothetical protein DRI57_32045 [Deltaproteobacteria bacterium]|nr:MAG: hypothetical protein DRI57_32045 [Deltaproteobacteria bacterium]
MNPSILYSLPPHFAFTSHISSVCFNFSKYSDYNGFGGGCNFRASHADISHTKAQRTQRFHVLCSSDCDFVPPVRSPYNMLRSLMPEIYVRNVRDQ